jgi:acyl-CoA dehydrogenase
MVTVGWIVLVLAIGWGLAYFRAPLLVWTVLVGAALALCTTLRAAVSPSLIVPWVIFAAVGLSLNLPPLRRALIGNRIFAAFRRVMPPMSNTEREPSMPGRYGGKPNCSAAIPIGNGCWHYRRRS